MLASREPAGEIRAAPEHPGDESRLCGRRCVQEALFVEAYESAFQSGDEHNHLLIAHSLAELYIADRGDSSKGRVWLTKLRDHMAELDEPDAQWRNLRTLMAHPARPLA